MITLEQYIDYTTRCGNEGFIEHQEEMKEWNKALIARFPWLTYEDDTSYYTTYLDDMPPGWYLAFGIQMCEEIDAVLKKYNITDYYVSQVKEKYGGLCWYDTCTCDREGHEELHKVIRKYELLSETTCCECGKPAHWISHGWICPYCDECKERIGGEYSEIKE